MDGWPAYEPVAKYLETSEKRRLLLLIGMVITMYQLLTGRVYVRIYFLTYLSILTDLLTQLLVCLLAYLPTCNYAYIVNYLFLVVRFIFSLIFI